MLFIKKSVNIDHQKRWQPLLLETLNSLSSFLYLFKNHNISYLFLKSLLKLLSAVLLHLTP